jgi:hypothetical protein
VEGIRFAFCAAACYSYPMRFLGRRPALAPLDEAAAYERCHGSRGSEVRIVKLPPRRPRYEDLLATGEQLRKLFEQRLDRREPE